MFVLGLTGGIASGKSTVSKLFREHKIPVIDLDEIAREVVQPGSPTLRRLVDAFGPDILHPDQSLNRAELGRRAFGSPEHTKTLNAITHRAIRRVMTFRLIKLWLTGTRCVVVDTPLLIEAGLYKWCAMTVVVWCSEKQQLARMLQRDGSSKGLTESDARARLAAQLPLLSKLAYADVVLDNSADAPGGSQILRDQVRALVSVIKGPSWDLLRLAVWLLTWLVPPLGLTYGYLYAVTHARKIATRHAQHVSVEQNKKEV